jgi:hypothetical protein
MHKVTLIVIHRDYFRKVQDTAILDLVPFTVINCCHHQLLFVTTY